MLSVLVSCELQKGDHGHGIPGKYSSGSSESRETVEVSLDNLTDCERSQSQLHDHSKDQLIDDHGECE